MKKVMEQYGRVVRTGLAMLALLIAVIVMGMECRAESFGTIKGYDVNVRESASSDSSAVAQVTQGNFVTIVSNETGADGYTWYRISTATGAAGYVRSDFVDLSSTAPTNPTTPTTPTTGTEGGTIAPPPVVGGDTGSTGTPTTGTPTTGTPTTGTPTTGTPTTGTPTTGTPTTGTPTTGSESTGSNLPAAAKVTDLAAKSAYISAEDVRIRDDAGTAGTVIATAAKSTEITINGEATAADGYKWYRISFVGGGKQMTGFVRSDLISYIKPESTPETTVIGGSVENDSKPETKPEEEPVKETDQTEPVEPEQPNETSENPNKDANEGTKGLTLLDNGMTPSSIPEGYTKCTIAWNESNIPAWRNGDYYIFYASADGVEDWYLYHSTDGKYLNYGNMLNSAAPVAEKPVSEEPAELTKGYKVLIGVLAVLVLALLIAVTVLLLRRNRNDDEYEYDEEEEPESREIKEEKKSVSVKQAEPRKNEQSESREKKKSGFGQKFVNFFTVEAEDDTDDDDDDDDDEYEEEDDDDSRSDKNKEKEMRDIDFIDL